MSDVLPFKPRPAPPAREPAPDDTRPPRPSPGTGGGLRFTLRIDPQAVAAELLRLAAEAEPPDDDGG
jgi:hypothetical protein